MENKKINLAETIKNIKTRHEEFIAKNPDFFQKLKEQKQKKDISLTSFEDFLKKLRESKEIK